MKNERKLYVLVRPELSETHENTKTRLRAINLFLEDVLQTKGFVYLLDIYRCLEIPVTYEYVEKNGLNKIAWVKEQGDKKIFSIRETDDSNVFELVFNK